MNTDNLKHPDNLNTGNHSGAPNVYDQEALDPGNQALTEALRICFALLKLVMFGVILLFAYSGLFKVEQNERAVVLRFGKVKGVGVKVIKQEGLHWAWPYPIEEIIKIPATGVERQLNADSFWYFETEEEKLGLITSYGGATLQIVRDGYSLTASGDAAKTKHFEGTGWAFSDKDVTATDYNLVHTRWAIRYSVSDPIAFVENLWDGTDDGWLSVERFLESALADAVIVTSANYDIDWIIWEKPQQFSDDVQGAISNRLNRLDVGLTVKLQLVDKNTPRQVKDDFDRANSAKDKAKTLENEAQGEYDQIVNAANAQADNIVAQANAYRQTIVQSAQADTRYLTNVLGKIKKTAQEKYLSTTPNYKALRQKAFDELLAVTVDELYQEMLREVIASAKETFIPPAYADVPTEWRIYLSRDTTLKPISAKQQE